MPLLIISGFLSAIPLACMVIMTLYTYIVVFCNASLRAGAQRSLLIM